MKRRYMFVSILVLSAIANAIFIPSYFHLRRSSHEVRTINGYVGGMVHDSAVDLQTYERTHSSKALGDAAIKLLDVSGELQQYNEITHDDGAAGQFGIMLGNIGGDLVLKQHVKRDSQIVSRISSELPYTDASVADIEGSQPLLDKRLETILQQFSQYGLY